MPRPHSLRLALALALTTSCGGPSRAEFEAAARRDVKASITADLTALQQAAVEMRAAAPAPDADGWNPTADRASVDAMRAAWSRARVAYERIEGAIAVLFPDVDHAIDARYDDFLGEGATDPNLFDGEGVTGMHALERILWADAAPSRVAEFEMRQVGDRYVAPAFPATADQARQFREGLVARLVDDVEQMQADFATLELDSAAAFRGVIGSMQEQLEKVDRAATAEEESRYAQHTLADMRANLAGARATFEIFVPWLARIDDGPALTTAIRARFDAIAARYAALPGDALPAVPSGYDPDAPSAADAATDYGALRALLVDECDPAREGSVVQQMGRAADALGIPQLPEAP